MISFQFYREIDQEVIIDVERKTYKPFPGIGYPLFAFICDAEIDIMGHGVKHPYWGTFDIQQENLFTAKLIQTRFRTIFDSLPDGKAMDVETFEQAMIKYGLQIPPHCIATTKDKKGNEYICDLYQCCNYPGVLNPILEQLCTAELYQLVKSGRTIKRCANCGKLFSPNKADEKYCVRLSKEYPGKNCKQAAKYKKQLQREHSSETLKLYKSINTMLCRRAMNAPLKEREHAQIILSSFRDEAYNWKRKLKSGEAQESEYIAWLNSFKKRRKK